MVFDAATGTVSFGIGVGTLVLATNVVLLSLYLCGCHTLRHILGGGRDKLSNAPLGMQCYSCVSFLNRKHMVWAWCSLCSVGFSDLYVRLCSMGVVDAQDLVMPNIKHTNTTSVVGAGGAGLEP